MSRFADEFRKGLDYRDFLDQHGTPEHRDRWQKVYEEITLGDHQLAVLSGFVREMKVIVLAGAWCGDCVNQCPIFERFAEANPAIQVRYLDRDENPELTERLSVNGGHRVPVVVFLSEDDFLCGIFGDRTLAKYRAMAAGIEASPSGSGADDGWSLLQLVTGEWLDEFERMQLMMRTSGRLRKLHDD